MWIVRHGNQMFNLDHYREIYVEKNCIEFLESAAIFKKIVFENEKEAEKNFKYIIEGLNRGASITYV